MTAKLDEARAEHRVRDSTIPPMDEKDALAAAQAGGWEVDALIDQMETELNAQGGLRKGFFDLEFKNPKPFAWVIVAFASMGGMVESRTRCSARASSSLAVIVGEVAS